MTFEELKHELKKYFFSIKKEGVIIYVTDNLEENENAATIAATIRNDERYILDTNWPDFKDLSLPRRDVLLGILYQYATTPVLMRYPQEYYYRLPHGLDDVAGFLNYHVEDQEISFSTSRHVKGKVETRFTDERFSELPADIQDFMKNLIKVKRSEVNESHIPF